MKKAKVILLTVGHSPREDLALDMISVLPDTVETEHCGALDEYNAAQVREDFLAESDEASYMTRLNDKTMAAVSAKKILPVLQEKITAVSAQGADAVVILCTSKFPAFSASIPVISPFSLLHSVVPAVAKGMKVAAAFPFAPYGEGMALDWKNDGIDIAWEYVTPGPDLTGEKLADVFKNKKADILVLDCISYTFQLKKEVSRILGIPVIQPKKLIADVLSTLFSI